jgi:hypothetical protein
MQCPSALLTPGQSARRVRNFISQAAHVRCCYVEVTNNETTAPLPLAVTLLTAALKRMLPSGSCAANASRISDRRIPLACSKNPGC